MKARVVCELLLGHPHAGPLGADEVPEVLADLLLLFFRGVQSAQVFPCYFFLDIR